jgi:NAD+ synthetase
LTYANVRPRARMSILYGISGELGFKTGRRARVMGTGHMSEDLIGYDTKGGDALCDIFILADLVKSEVYQLAEHYRVPRSIIEAVPSAGLYPGQTDEEELGHSYAALEPATLVLGRLLRDGVPLAEIDPEHRAFEHTDPTHAKFVVERFRIHSHKHQAPAVVALRRPGWFDPA